MHRGSLRRLFGALCAAQRDPSSKCFPSASAPLSLPSLVGHDRLSQVVILDGLRMTGQRHPLKELIDKQNPCV